MDSDSDAPALPKFHSLQYEGRSVGTAMLFCGTSDQVRRVIHGHELKQFAGEGEDLVAVWQVQIFEEFAETVYPYDYRDFDEPPSCLGDLNIAGRHFKSIVAWDMNKLCPTAGVFYLEANPKQVSADSLPERGEVHSSDDFRALQLPTGRSDPADTLCPVQYVADPLTEQAPCVPRRPYIFRSRKQATRRRPSELRQRRVLLSNSLENPFLKPRRCCKSKCFHRVDPVYSFAKFKAFMQMRREEFKRTLIGMLREDRKRFEFQGRRVCSRFLQIGFHFSTCLQSCVKRTECSRASPSAIALPRDVRSDTKKDFILMFLRRFSEEVGDKMPHREHVVIPALTREQVYAKFSSFFLHNASSSLTMPKLSYFYRTWKSECPEIRTRRNHGFQVCSRCEQLQVALADAHDRQDERNMLKEQLRRHIDVMSDERRGYMERRILAEKHPKKYCSIILDGADQKGYGLPHFVISTKSDKGHKIGVKCVGVLEHRKYNKLTLYTMTEEFKTGANHVLEALHRTLDTRKKELGSLPPILFIQADNCTRENKNRYFMAYLEMLVAMGVFCEIQMSFLPIGHTHADIDQSFSAVSRRLKVVDAITMTDLLEELQHCYKPKASSSQLEKVINFSGLCDKSKCLTTVANFSKFRYFKFSRGDGDIVNGRCRTICEVKITKTQQWKPISSVTNASGFLSFVPNLAQTPDSSSFPPDNVTDVNMCLRSMEERIGNPDKVLELEMLRDTVYKRRVDALHWDLETCFELNGDFVDMTSMPQIMLADDDGEIESSREHHFVYNANMFVAVKTDESESVDFWVGQVLRVSEQDDHDRAKSLDVRWYISMEGCNDEYTARYEPATVYNGSMHIAYVDRVDVQSVLVEFEKLTNRGCLYETSRRAIQQVLDRS